MHDGLSLVDDYTGILHCRIWRQMKYRVVMCGLMWWDLWWVFELNTGKGVIYIHYIYLWKWHFSMLLKLISLIKIKSLNKQLSENFTQLHRMWCNLCTLAAVSNYTRAHTPYQRDLYQFVYTALLNKQGCIVNIYKHRVGHSVRIYVLSRV